MGETSKIDSIIDQVVNNVLSSKFPELREQIVRQVVEALMNGGLGAGTPAGTRTATEETYQLDCSLAAIQTGTSQVEILDAMIEGAAKFASRAALFVVRGPNGVGWRARGFSDDEAIRSSPLELGEGLAAKALEARGMVSSRSADFMPGFDHKFGASLHDALMLPLIVRDKPVALLYADGGVNQQQLDPAALQTLVRVSGLWLEVFATRKATGAMASAPPPPVSAQVMAAAAAGASVVTVVPAPVETMSSAVETTPVVAEPVSELEPIAEPVAEPVAAAAPAASAPSGAEGEVHKKARRFAKLLVDEIKLYNQGKVSEGRQHRDLYDRLREDIEKSRASYEKRYGSTSAKDGDYFNQELVRILADNDPALLGNNFKR
jgi:hypothetical protein